MMRWLTMLVMALAVLAAPVAAQDAPAATLFRNVRVFDGVGPALSPTTDVRVEGNVITRIAPRQSAAGIGRSWPQKLCVRWARPKWT